MIGSAVAYLRALEAGGTPLDAARGMIYFRLAADADQFLTIAKFRALRKLWARVEQACGLEPKPAYVSAETAWRMMTQRDPYVNILRTTIAVFSAGIGGADAIGALPHTAALGLPDRFARRVARNAQLLLLEEFEPRPGRRPGGRLRRDRGPDRKAVRRRVGAVPGIRARRRRRPGAGTRTGAGEDRRGARRASAGGGGAQGRTHRHQRLPRSRRDAGRCARRQAQAGSAEPAIHHHLSCIAAHPPRRAVRATARRLRPHAGQDRLTAENFSRQPRYSGRIQCARRVRKEFLRGRRHRGGAPTMASPKTTP